MVVKEQAKIIPIGDLFRESWSLYRERVGVLTKIILLPVAFLVAGDLLGLFAPSGLASLPAFIGTMISLLSYLALIFALQGSVQFGEAYRMAWKKIWSYGWLTVLSGFVTLGGFVVFVIPGIIFSIWFVFAIYTFAIEGEKGMNALLRSREYVLGHWWSVFGRQIVFGLAALVAIMLLGLAGRVLGGEVGVSLVVNLFTLLLAPLAVVYVYTLYQNLKLLKPKVTNQSPQGPRGFFYFSAVLGVLGLIILMALLIIGAFLFPGALEQQGVLLPQ
jgi:hypothetical protein